MRTGRINITLSDQMRIQIKQIAEEEEQSVGAYIRELIKKDIKRRKKRNG